MRRPGTRFGSPASICDVSTTTLLRAAGRDGVQRWGAALRVATRSWRRAGALACAAGGDLHWFHRRRRLLGSQSRKEADRAGHRFASFGWDCRLPGTGRSLANYVTGALSTVTTAQIALIISGLAVLVAVFSAATSHRALAWQKGRDAERRTVAAHMDVDHGWILQRSLEGDRDLGWRYKLTVSVTNDSEDAVAYLADLDVWGLAVEHAPPPVSEVDKGGAPGGIVWGPSGDLTGQDLLGQAGDVRLEPRQRVTRTLLIDDANFDRWGGGFRINARFASGQVVRIREKCRQRYKSSWGASLGSDEGIETDHPSSGETELPASPAGPPEPETCG
jgi:hypothetical protein